VHRRSVGLALLLVSLAVAGCAKGGGHGAAATAPQAAFEFSPAAPAVAQPVRFEDRSNGTIANRTWDFGDGTQATASPVNHSYATVGVYEVRLTVRDAGGASSDASHFVAVGGAGGPSGFQLDFRYKVDGLEADFEPVVTPRSVRLETYVWDFGDGKVSREPAPVHRYAAKDEYTVVLRASGKASVATATHKVAVGVASSEPSGLAGRSFVVVAVIDSGINPYHSEFRDPQFNIPPSRYIAGYPSDATELPLSLDARSMDEALKKDQTVWKSVKTKSLYWVPGTRIIGAWSQVKEDATPILDENVHGHGTATASDAAGATIGSCPDCLIVAIEGGSAQGYLDAIQWAVKQPWIDVITNSWGVCLATCQADTGLLPPLAVDDGGFVAATRGAVEAGKEIFFAAGNGILNGFDVPTPTYYNFLTGPDWIVTVGAADVQSGAAVAGTGRPVDIVSLGLGWKAAAHNSMDAIKSFDGTSAAAPVAAGAYARALLAARDRFNDTIEGPHGAGVVAAGAKGAGMAADGKVTRYEVERALFLTARRASSVAVGFPPVVLLPDSPAAFTYVGYGLVDAGTAAEAAKVLLGAKPVPTRANEDQWAAADSRIRQAIWGSYERGGELSAVSSDGRMQAIWDALGPAQSS
jgi:PKD repeat protein